MKMQSRAAALAAALALGTQAFVSVSAAGAAEKYSVDKRVELSGAGRWDYISVDTVRHRVFIARSDHLDVVDADSGALVGSIPGLAGVHGAVFAQDLKLGFASNGRSDTITVFDLDTLKPMKEIKVSGSNPDALLYHAKSRRLYAFNGKTANASVIDATTLAEVKTIALGGKPEAASSDDARIFVNIEDNATLAVIDAATAAVQATWPLAGCADPTGLAYDALRARVFSVCANGKMVVTDAATGLRVAEAPIGAGPDGAEYDAAGRNVLSSNGKSGTLTVIHQDDADHYAVTANVATGPGARTMALDPQTRRIYLPTVAAEKFTVLMVAPH